MGLSSDEFWSLTVPEWNALLKAHKRKIYGDRFIQAAFYANWLNSKTDPKKSKTKLLKPQDLLPDIDSDKPKRDWKKDQEEAFRLAREEDERCGIKR